MVSDASLKCARLWTVCWSITREIEAGTNVVRGESLVWIWAHQ